MFEFVLLLDDFVNIVLVVKVSFEPGDFVLVPLNSDFLFLEFLLQLVDSLIFFRCC